MSDIEEFSLELMSRLTVILDEDTLYDVKEIVTGLVKEIRGALV